MPLPDFRTIADQVIARPSADLLDTVYLCERRQEWYRDFARANREEPVAFVGSLTTATPVLEAATMMRTTLGFDIAERSAYPTWTAALSGLAERAEDAGVLVMINGVVTSSTRRKLDPEEFRGFALADDLAPVVFINGADTKAAQIFTLAHELAHIWLGQTALDDAEMSATPTNDIERWCNQVAAELLVPLAVLREQFDPANDLTEELDRLERVFKVSTLVVLRRVHDAGWLSLNEYGAAYGDELQRVLTLAAQRGSSGGNFYNTTPVRTSKRFARAIITSTLEGQTLYRDAARLLGFKKLSTLDELGRQLGVA
ncbi:MAG: ImmA/IrrE family metallo-endopeptidase [Rhodococcus sp. (in: high G+C Gram-positive bacteria)]